MGRSSFLHVPKKKKGLNSVKMSLFSFGLKFGSRQAGVN